MNIIHNSNVIRIGKDIPVASFMACKELIWYNNGLYGRVFDNVLKNMQQNLKNLADHPNLKNNPKPRALEIHWAHTCPTDAFGPHIDNLHSKEGRE